MGKVIPRLDWKGGYDNLIIKRHDDGEFILWDLAYPDGRILAKATQPFHRHTEAGYPAADPGCFWIKNYSEHMGLGDALIKAGVLERTGRQVAYGPWDATSDEYRFINEYSDDPVLTPENFLAILIQKHFDEEFNE